MFGNALFGRRFVGAWKRAGCEGCSFGRNGTAENVLRPWLAGLDAGAALYGLQIAHNERGASRVTMYPLVRAATDTPPVPTPEPSSLLLMSLGLFGTMMLLRRGKGRK